MKQKEKADFLDRTIPEPNSGCWLWLGSTNNKYGKFRGRLAHRVSFELFNGPLKEGLFVCHKCDTPICVNPQHLFLGTRSDNQRDCGNKKRFKVQKDKNFGHKVMVHALKQSENYKTHLRIKKITPRIFKLLKTGLSQRKVAKIVGINQMTVSRLVRSAN